jgi:MarR family protein
VRPSPAEEHPPLGPDFAFLTNHGKSLLLIAADPRIRMRDVARLLHITERAAQRIVADLVRAGYIEREREGRRNLYTVRTHLPLGLPIQRDIDIGTLLAVLPAPEDAVDQIPE